MDRQEKLIQEYEERRAARIEAGRRRVAAVSTRSIIKQAMQDTAATVKAQHTKENWKKAIKQVLTFGIWR